MIKKKSKFIVLLIEDTGGGINRLKIKIEYLKGFYRVMKQEKNQGTGLGLAYVKTYVNKVSMAH